MSKSIVIAALFALSLAAWGQAPDQVVELKDGGRIVIKEGFMAHYDAAGNRVKMRDGVTMTAKDGSKLMMRNNALWRQITEHGTLKPTH